MTRYEWRYVPRGRVAHAIPFGESYSKSLCGLYPWTTGWMGTGNQDEYDRAASLPVCQRCNRERDE